MYIALEGVKGTGKSTVFQQLQAALTSDGITVIPLCPTRPVSPPNLLERLADLRRLRSSDTFRERLYAMRSNHAARRVPRLQGQLLLGDRSRLTSYVTRWSGSTAASREASIARVNALEPLIGLPDHVLYLHAPVEVLRARLEARLRVYGREDETPDRLAAQLSAYEDLQRHAADLGLAGVRWHRIEASVPAEQVVDQCLRTARAVFATEPTL